MFTTVILTLGTWFLLPEFINSENRTCEGSDKILVACSKAGKNILVTEECCCCDFFFSPAVLIKLKFDLEW